MSDKQTSLLLLFALLPLTAGNAIFTMKDAEGDDNGAGAISYPSGADFERGDLDLISFSAEADKKGTWFEVSFANPVRKPDKAVSRSSNLPMKDIVDNDFYTLNVDIYIDTDGKKGSGNTSALPGRDITVNPDTAWEKAIVLTPRPSAAQNVLRGLMTKKHRRDIENAEGSLSQGRAKEMKKEMRTLVEDQFFFPTKVKVRARTIRFFVPKDFLGGVASANWRYLVLVTGADPEQRTDLPYLSRRGAPGLMMMPFNQGRPFESFRTDYDSDPGQPRIVDALFPTAQQQVTLLSNFDTVKEIQAVLPAIAPSQTDIDPPPPAKPMVVSKKDGKLTVKPVAKSKPTADRLLKPKKKSTKQPVAVNKSVKERLKELEELRKDGLITEEEYKTLRKKILEEL